MAADFTQGTGFAGPNLNQLKYLPTDLVSLLSINPDNAARAVRYDVAWLAAKRPDGKSNADYILERWLAWRAG